MNPNNSKNISTCNKVNLIFKLFLKKWLISANFVFTGTLLLGWFFIYFLLNLFFKLSIRILEKLIHKQNIIHILGKEKKQAFNACKSQNPNAG